jgi:hypothetical protein
VQSSPTNSAFDIFQFILPVVLHDVGMIFRGFFPVHGRIAPGPALKPGHSGENASAEGLESDPRRSAATFVRTRTEARNPSKRVALAAGMAGCIRSNAYGSQRSGFAGHIRSDSFDPQASPINLATFLKDCLRLGCARDCRSSVRTRRKTWDDPHGGPYALQVSR